ncbi:hypothetical protein BaRGS_00009633 [Batillaria attramentaria]|uniref:Uncharacterized protein n=1 Tax=Batillaria attramentaria TaxID=370345 RepID=A0ABD0LIH4_9CAEN
MPQAMKATTLTSKLFISAATGTLSGKPPAPDTPAYNHLSAGSLARADESAANSGIRIEYRQYLVVRRHGLAKRAAVLELSRHYQDLCVMRAQLVGYSGFITGKPHAQSLPLVSQVRGLDAGPTFLLAYLPRQSESDG